MKKTSAVLVIIVNSRLLRFDGATKLTDVLVAKQKLLPHFGLLECYDKNLKTKIVFFLCLFFLPSIFSRSSLLFSCPQACGRILLGLNFASKTKPSISFTLN